MSQTLFCAICVSNNVAVRAQIEQLAAANHGGEPPELPPVLRAVTLFGGTAICEGHIISSPDQPGDAARRSGLIL